MMVSLFPGFVGGGFECSSHVRGDGRRLDLLQGTKHDLFAREDFQALRGLGIHWARDGLRWHIAEPRPGKFCWKSWQPLLDAAADCGIEIWWDLIHFGFPEWCNPFGQDFVERSADYAGRAARHQRASTGQPGRFCPVNEISFLAFAAGQMGWFYPHARDLGHQLKLQLVRAAIAMANAIRAEDPGALLLCAEPLIEIVARHSEGRADAARASEAQFEAVDWLIGAAHPELGGHRGLIDVLGLNHYPHNQHWIEGGMIGFGSLGYVSLSRLLARCAARYPAMPLLLAETGAEDAARGPWLSYIRQEVEAARSSGAQIVGACVYPITDYPGWDDDRHCPTGLLGMTDTGVRPVHAPTLRAIHELETLRPGGPSALQRGHRLASGLDLEDQHFRSFA
jgi:hypothetical protein